MENPTEVRNTGCAVPPRSMGWIWVLSRDQTRQNVGNNTTAGEEGNLLLFSTVGFGEAKNRAWISLKA